MRTFGTLIATAVLLAGAPALAQEAIKIGGIVPLSPPGGVQTGESMRDGMTLAVEELNANGGLLGRPVELKVEDSGGTPEKGIAAFERLASKEGVVAVQGEAHSVVCTAVGPVAEKYNLPFVAGECWSDEVTAAGHPQVFRLTVANSLVFAVAADWVKEAGFKNVAVIAENSDWGFGVIDVFTKNLKDNGVNVTSFTGENTTTDFTPQLLELRRAEPRPDLIVAGFTGSALLLLMKQAADLGLAPSAETAMFSAGADVLEPEFWNVMGDKGVHVIANPAGLPGRPDTEKARNFSKAYEARFGRPANAVAMEGYDGVMVVAEAIRARNSTDPNEIMAGLRELSWEGPRGVISFSAETDPAWKFQQWLGVPIYVIQYTEPNQSPSDAAVLWPRAEKTVDELVLRP
ncbi:MAG: ABC transporter substrate-binding protein [Gemmobacter sp.]|jgi:branched-chain amino acid transport system substrate-binding protein|nr:ABC transporter substrate-binding protein [Gemmobacter sp.]